MACAHYYLISLGTIGAWKADKIVNYFQDWARRLSYKTAIELLLQYALFGIYTHCYTNKRHVWRGDTIFDVTAPLAVLSAIVVERRSYWHGLNGDSPGSVFFIQYCIRSIADSQSRARGAWDMIGYLCFFTYN